MEACKIDFIQKWIFKKGNNNRKKPKRSGCGSEKKNTKRSTMKKLLFILFLSNIAVAQTTFNVNGEKYSFYTDSIIIGDVNFAIYDAEVDLIRNYPVIRAYSDTCQFVISHNNMVIFNNHGMPKIISYSTVWLFDPWINAVQYQDNQVPYDYHTYYLPTSKKVRIIKR